MKFILALIAKRTRPGAEFRKRDALFQMAVFSYGLIAIFGTLDGTVIMVSMYARIFKLLWRNYLGRHNTESSMPGMRQGSDDNTGRGGMDRPV